MLGRESSGEFFFCSPVCKYLSCAHHHDSRFRLFSLQFTSHQSQRRENSATLLTQHDDDDDAVSCTSVPLFSTVRDVFRRCLFLEMFQFSSFFSFHFAWSNRKLEFFFFDGQQRWVMDVLEDFGFDILNSPSSGGRPLINSKWNVEGLAESWERRKSQPQHRCLDLLLLVPS